MNKKPNFLIVGAAKSGSTSLYKYLSQHPEVFMPVNKEPNYFVAEYQQKMAKDCPSYKIDMNRMVFDKNAYYNLFNKATLDHKAIGEASVTYLFKPEFAIPKIKKELGEPRIIIILRNPIKRAFSHYSYACELGLETLNFEDALDAEDNRLKNNWSSTFAYINQGLFYEQVKAYKKAFSNVHVLVLDDFVKNNQLELKKIYTFLNIENSFKNNFEENFNITGQPKIKLLHKFLVQDDIVKNKIKPIVSLFFSEEKLRKFARKLRSMNQGDKLFISELDIQKLNGIYKEDVNALSQLLNLNLTKWLNE
jgi:hypothetical protein